MATNVDAARMWPKQDRWRTLRRVVLSAGVKERTRLWLVAAAVMLTGLAQVSWADRLPRGIFAPVLIVAGLVLTPGPLLITFGLVTSWLVASFVINPGQRGPAVASCLALGLIMCLMYVLSTSRASVGLVGIVGDRMLLDLRQRQRVLARMPSLPAGWHAEAEICGANGESFSGDFLINATSQDGSQLEFAMVDVSGKGLGAGTRSLMLSSALSGLLGQVAPDKFLPAANVYLLRQQWREGFATAVHLAIDPVSGQFSVDSAGHLPVMMFQAGSGTWCPIAEATGPVLGVMDGMDFPRATGELARGDALLLYTDGVVERRDAKLNDGIDWMLGMCDRTRSNGFHGLADRLCADAPGGLDDDRAVLLIWRT